MSSGGWLGTKSFVTSLAKTALQEAQKTIDRAIEMKEEYEAQEAAALASMQREGGGVGLMSDDSAWGAFSDPYLGPLGVQQSKSSDAVTEETSEPVSSQPKTSTSSLPHEVPMTPAAGSITPTSSSVMEGSGEFDADSLRPRDCREGEDLLMSTSGASELSIATSFPSLNAVASNPISPESQSSIEILSAFVEVNKSASAQSSTDVNSSMSSTMTMVVPVDEGDPGVREPAEGQEMTSNAGSFMSEAINDADSHRPASAATSSSKSYELIQLEHRSEEAKTSKPSGQGSSGHNSGDDFEGTTATSSSDIEVISNVLCETTVSSPSNASSPTTGSRKFGPSERKDGAKKGHNRTTSDISTAACSDESSSEVDRLSRKLSEVHDILEARESKLVEMSRANLELQEQNTDLSSQVKEARQINCRLQESNLSTEEFTQRLSAMEKKLQQTMAEREKWKLGHDNLKKEASTRMSQAQVDEILSEKDETIDGLRKEGEDLSKQAGKHTEIIRKLRGKEKSLEKELKSIKEKLTEKTEEVGRLSRNLSSKNEVESKQIEAVRDLSSANAKWEDENLRLNSDLEDSSDQVAALRLSLETAHKEIMELRKGLIEKSTAEHEMEVEQERELRRNAEKKMKEANESHRNECDSLLRQMDELRVEISFERKSSAIKEDQMRREREELLQRLADSEARNEVLSASISTATRPLVRQLESLQSSLTEAQANAERVERGLAERLQQTTLQLSSSQERERNAAEQLRNVSAKVAALDSRLANGTKTLAEAEAKIESLECEKSKLEEARSKEACTIDSLKKSFVEEIAGLERDKNVFEVSLEAIQSDLENEKMKNVGLVEQLDDREKKLKDAEVDLRARRFSELQQGSPTPSLSASQVGASDQSWLLDEVMESGSVLGHSKMSYNNARLMRGSTTALMEYLQAQLKQKEGGTIQLQMEIAGLERVKEGLSSELAKSSEKANQVHLLEEQIRALNRKHSELEQKYQTMLTMYGEKVEETEELKLDLQDVKEMYKVQIQELLQGGRNDTESQ